MKNLGRPAAKTSKYRNVRTVVDGHKFASGKEASRYQELKLLEKAGEILELQLQPRYKIVVNSYHICTYVGDFKYRYPNVLVGVVEDVKGYKTPLYKLKKALMMAVYGMEVKEV